MQVLKKKQQYRLLIVIPLLTAIILSYVMCLQLVNAETEYIYIHVYSCGGSFKLSGKLKGDSEHCYFSVQKGLTTNQYLYADAPEGKVYEGVYTEPNGKGVRVTDEHIGYMDTDASGGDNKFAGFSIHIEKYFDNDTSLYVNWVDPVLITLDANGGTLDTKEGLKESMQMPFTPNKRNFIYYGDYNYNTEPAISREGYDFLGWSTNPNAKTGSFLSDFYFNEDTTVYAIWKQKEYQIIITNGVFDERGYETQYTKTVKKGDTASLQFTLYDFKDNLNSGNYYGGIFTAPSGTGNQIMNECTYNADDGTYQIEEEYTPSEDVVLHIYWSPGITLKLDANGGLFNDGNQTHIQNRAPNVIWKEIRGDASYNVPVRKGYKFNGWYPKSNAVYGFSLDDYLATSSTTLYATWEYLPQSLDLVTLRKNSLELVTNKTEKLLLSNVPDDATVSWASSNPSVATVDKDGLVTAETYGTAVISATVTKGDEVLKLLCNVQTRFYDVADKTMSGYTQIYWAADNGITKGYNGGEYFGPTQKCTRQEFAIFLWRALGQPAPKSTTLPFKDTKDLTSSSLNAIAWATEKGIIKGYDDNTFRPKNNVTREQIVIMLWRAAGEPKASKDPGFADTGSLDKTRSSYKAIAWASENGIVQGFYADNTFRPKDNSKRNQVVIMLYRYVNKFLKA